MPRPRPGGRAGTSSLSQAGPSIPATRELPAGGGGVTTPTQGTHDRKNTVVTRERQATHRARRCDPTPVILAGAKPLESDAGPMVGVADRVRRPGRAAIDTDGPEPGNCEPRVTAAASRMRDQ